MTPWPIHQKGRLSNYVSSIRTGVGVGVICFQSDTLATKGMTIVISVDIIYREGTHICVQLDLLAMGLRSEDMGSPGRGVGEDWLTGDKLGLLSQDLWFRSWCHL